MGVPEKGWAIPSSMTRQAATTLCDKLVKRSAWKAYYAAKSFNPTKPVIFSTLSIPIREDLALSGSDFKFATHWNAANNPPKGKGAIYYDRQNPLHHVGSFPQHALNIEFNR
jgi:hypothetical protein